MSSPIEVVFYSVSIGSLLGAGAIARWVVRRISRANKADTETTVNASLTIALDPVLEKLGALADKLDVVDSRSRRVEVQVYNNGGTTMHDKIVQSLDTGREAVAIGRETKARLEDHLQESRDDRARLAHVERTLIRRTD